MNFLVRYPVLLAILGQMIFSTSDVLARANLRGKEFSLVAFHGWWALAWLSCHLAAMFIQFYLFTNVPVGRVIGLMALVSLVLSNVAGYLFLSEVLSPVQYFGLVLGVAALLCLSWT